VIPRRSYQSLDAWRGFAALWVVSFHLSEIVIARDGSALHHPLFAFGHAGKLSLPVFFVVSGFCIAHAALGRGARDVRSFAWARVQRIYPTYWLAAMLTLSISLVVAALANHGLAHSSALGNLNPLDRSPAFFLANFALVHYELGVQSVVFVSWSLCYEVAFYGIVGLLLCLPRPARRPRLILNALHALTVYTLAVPLVRGVGLPFPFDLWSQFGLGVLVFDLLSSPPSLVPRLALSVVALEVGWLELQHGFSLAAATSNAPATFVSALTCALALLVLHRHDDAISRSLPGRALAWVGRCSYSLYLVHSMVIGAVKQLLERALHGAPLGVSFFAVGLGASLLAGHLLFVTFERRLMHLRSGASPAPRQLAGLGATE
jgi:peptidoglycan/LPS O-acetylase OafA/YrhL